MIRLFFCFILTVSTVFAYSQDTDYVRIKDSISAGASLKKMAQELKTYQSDFVQVKHLQALGASIEAKGKFWYKNGNKMRWEYIDPYKYAIYVIDDKITIDDGGTNSGFKNKGNSVFRQINDIIEAGMTGSLITDDSFDVIMYENEEFYQIRMIPAESQVKSIISAMYMFFEKTNVSLKSIKLVEKAGDFTTITFVNRNVNASISETVFTIN